MSIEQMELKLALENAKAQILHLEEIAGRVNPKDMKPTSLDAIALIDTEIYKLQDAPVMDLELESASKQTGEFTC